MENMKIHPTDLPNEILATIINELTPPDTEDNDLETLAACRLASHTLCSLATPLLFSFVQLAESAISNGIEGIKKWLLEFNQILTTNKDIASSVHSLTLSCPKHNFEDTKTGSTIAQILRRLPQIRDFTLEASEREYLGDSLDFSLISWNLVSAIQELFVSPNLTNLNLCNISCFPLVLITPCPNIQHIYFTQINFSHDDDMDNTSNLQGSYLDSLAIDECSLGSLGTRIRDHIVFTEYFSQLKNLQITNEDLMLTHPWDIILQVSQTLTTLDIYREFDLPTDMLEAAPYNLSRFPALRHFGIQLPIDFEDNRLMLRFLDQLLSISSSTSLIETLEIKITWSLGRDEHGKDVLSLDAGWSTLDEILSSDKFPSLTHVAFFLNMMVRGTVAPDYNDKLQLEKDSTFPCVDALLPMLRALSDNTLRALDIDIDLEFL